MSEGDSERPSAYGKALDLLARRAHFRAELAAKLTARGYEDDEIGSALDRLAAEGYLNDTATAGDFAEMRRSRAPEGRRKLAAELARRGAGSAAIESVISTRTDEEEIEAARAAANRFLRGGRKDAAALARHLDRKGFSAGIVRSVLREQEIATLDEIAGD